MSHFYTLVLVPARDDEPDDDAYLTRVLAPYDEARETPAYETDCACVGRRAVTETVDAVEAAFPLDALRAQLRAEFPTDTESKAAGRRWAVLIAPRRAAYDAQLAAHPARHKPDPTCSECLGTGRYMSNYNPQSKWDWWHVGGRWSDLPHAPSAFVSTLLVDADFARNVVPFALVDEDGHWHERGRMGWFGIAHDEQPEDEWAAKVRRLLENAEPTTRAVVVDCHI